MLMRTTSAIASESSAVFFSNAVSSSPRSRPSLPSQSMMTVHLSIVAAVEAHTPFVVWFRPFSASISANCVPKTRFRRVDFPLLWGPMIATIP